MPSLVIMESPAKANTVQHYLGSGYKVMASVGHVRDLPKSTLGVDIENGFAAKYINIRGKGDLIKALKKEAKAATKVYLATDPDREGEAISWHLAAVLGIPVEETRRITFNEVTKTAVKAAIKNPRNIDMDMVNSQQARRILDRIVGYKLSPFLWKTVRSGLSAGRVQSVATRIIVERENEIRAFIPDEYWTVDADLETAKKKKFTAHFYGTPDGKRVELKNEADAKKVTDAAGAGTFTVASVRRASRLRNPAPPFTTSTMLQEASRRLGFQSARIMKVAQELYEGINLGTQNGGVHGLITYMRTDSLRISDEAQKAAESYIRSAYGDSYYPASPRVYRADKNAQDAHEAIRPSDLSRDPDSIKKHLTSDQYKLYRLIWSRFVASQMASAELDTVTADFVSGGYLFRASGTTVRFPGFIAVYDFSEEDENAPVGKSRQLPELNEKEELKRNAVSPRQHFTEPPARFNEASLIEFLKDKGIGRPSTYTPIITTILARGYVEREGKSLRPTPLGEVTTRLMVERFPDIVDYAFTARMEDDLDSIEEKKNSMEDVLGDFYAGFDKALTAAFDSVGGDKVEVPVEETDIVCEKCGARMVIKSGRFGKFAACPNYPTCKNTKPLAKDGTPVENTETAEPIGVNCEKCGAPMVRRKGRFGEFIACSDYPKCKNTRQISKSIGVKCPLCGSDIVSRHGKNRSFFYSCESYPTCKFVSWDLPVAGTCPDCGKPLYLKKGKDQLICKEKACGYKKDLTAEEAAEFRKAAGLV